MSLIQEIKEKIISLGNRDFEKEIISIEDIEYPPKLEMGDLSLPMFKLAKVLGKNPAELAQEYMSKFEDYEMVKTVTVMGAYLNFKLDKFRIAEKLLIQIEDENTEFGKLTQKKPRKIMVEYSNINTHKEYHAGHLRNISFGDSVSRILLAAGNNVVPVSYINDFGGHVAKTIWALQEFYDSSKLPENKGKFLGEVYVRAVKELEKNEIGKRLVGGIMKKIESRVGEEYELWKKTRQWSIDQFDMIYKELGIKFDAIFYESEYIDDGLEKTDELLKKGILEESNGAIIANLEKENLSVLLFKRSDGTALYPVADLALAIKKFDDYNLDESIYVVDNRQTLHFKQLFKVFEKMGYQQKMVHLAHDFVKLPSGMMSSRSGNTVTYYDIKDDGMKRAIQGTAKRHEDWNKEKIEKVATKLVNGAIKFEMLKVGSDQIITFDLDKALSFEGYTASYIQYTYARIQSILKKADIKLVIHNSNFDLLVEEKEQSIILKLLKYPGVIQKSATQYDPSEIAKYLFELAQLSNDFYHSIQILKSEKETKLARLALVKSIAQVLKNGLELLGVEVIDEM